MSRVVVCHRHAPSGDVIGALVQMNAPKWSVEVATSRESAAEKATQALNLLTIDLSPADLGQRGRQRLEAIYDKVGAETLVVFLTQHLTDGAFQTIVSVSGNRKFISRWIDTNAMDWPARFRKIVEARYAWAEELRSQIDELDGIRGSEASASPILFGLRRGFKEHWEQFKGDLEVTERLKPLFGPAPDAPADLMDVENIMHEAGSQAMKGDFFSVFPSLGLLRGSQSRVGKFVTKLESVYSELVVSAGESGGPGLAPSLPDIRGCRVYLLEPAAGRRLWPSCHPREHSVLPDIVLPLTDSREVIVRELLWASISQLELGSAWDWYVRGFLDWIASGRVREVAERERPQSSQCFESPQNPAGARLFAGFLDHEFGLAFAGGLLRSGARTPWMALAQRSGIPLENLIDRALRWMASVSGYGKEGYERGAEWSIEPCAIRKHLLDRASVSVRLSPASAESVRAYWFDERADTAPPVDCRISRREDSLCPPVPDGSPYTYPWLLVVSTGRRHLLPSLDNGRVEYSFEVKRARSATG
ncbi:MAG: hypothetical protein U0Q16_05200 [Bryobacteraceae bacterium]